MLIGFLDVLEGGALELGTTMACFSELGLSASLDCLSQISSHTSSFPLLETLETFLSVAIFHGIFSWVPV